MMLIALHVVFLTNLEPAEVVTLAAVVMSRG